MDVQYVHIILEKVLHNTFMFSLVQGYYRLDIVSLR